MMNLSLLCSPFTHQSILASISNVFGTCCNVTMLPWLQCAQRLRAESEGEVQGGAGEESHTALVELVAQSMGLQLLLATAAALR